MPESAAILLRVLLDSSLRVVFVAVGIALLLFVLRVRSNSWRHAVWAAVLCSMLVMPAFRYWMPPIPFPVTNVSPQIGTVVSYIRSRAIVPT